MYGVQFNFFCSNFVGAAIREARCPVFRVISVENRDFPLEHSEKTAIFATKTGGLGMIELIVMIILAPVFYKLCKKMHDKGWDW